MRLTGLTRNKTRIVGLILRIHQPIAIVLSVLGLSTLDRSSCLNLISLTSQMWWCKISYTVAFIGTSLFFKGIILMIIAVK